MGLDVSAAGSARTAARLITCSVGAGAAPDLRASDRTPTKKDENAVATRNAPICASALVRTPLAAKRRHVEPLMAHVSLFPQRRKGKRAGFNLPALSVREEVATEAHAKEIAGVFLNAALNHGDWRAAEALITRVYRKPREYVETVNRGKRLSEISHEEEDELIARVMDEGVERLSDGDTA